MSSLAGVKGGRRHISWRLPQLDEELNTCISGENARGFKLR